MVPSHLSFVGFCSVAAFVFLLAYPSGAVLLRGKGGEGYLSTDVNTSNASGIAAGSDGAAVNQTGAQRPPRVYFLFMAMDKVSNIGVWRSFFAQAPVSQYRAFVHCKFPSCLQQVSGSPLVAVPTVPSYYCTDLVSPMNQLLATALSHDAHDQNPKDKFAFISDSSLPAKPFAYIYSTLVARDGSDFCTFPSAEWADISGIGGLEVAVKYHQWITLNREHASRASQLWSSGHLHNLMAKFRMNTQNFQWSNNSFADSRNFGCLDEFWHMAALYGPLQNVDGFRHQSVNLPNFIGGPLQVTANAGWQGTCDTFVIWSKYLHTPGPNPFERLHSSLDPPSIPHSGTSARPGWWDTISLTGISAIRQSDFLFVRKFIDGPTLFGGGSFELAYSQTVVLDAAR